MLYTTEYAIGMSIHRRWKLLLCCKSVLILTSKSAKNCGISLLEICFLKGLHRLIADDQISSPLFAREQTYLLSTHIKRHSGVMMKHIV